MPFSFVLHFFRRILNIGTTYSLYHSKPNLNINSSSPSLVQLQGTFFLFFSVFVFLNVVAFFVFFLFLFFTLFYYMFHESDCLCCCWQSLPLFSFLFFGRILSANLKILSLRTIEKRKDWIWIGFQSGPAFFVCTIENYVLLSVRTIEKWLYLSRIVEKEKNTYQRLRSCKKREKETE